MVIDFIDPYFTAAYFDHEKRYSFGRQPEAALWALRQLGNSLKHILSEEIINQILNQFSNFFNISLAKHFAWRLGIKEIEIKNVNKILSVLFKISREHQIDFATFFYDFYGGSEIISDCLKSTKGSKYKINEFQDIFYILKETNSVDNFLEKKMSLKNNYENLLIDEVELIWEQIDKKNDWTFLETKVALIRQMGDTLGSKKIVNF